MDLTKHKYLIIFACILLFSCSREYTFEKRLPSKWNILNITTFSYVAGDLVKQESTGFYGSFDFNDDNSGVFTDRNSVQNQYTWTNKSADSVFIQSAIDSLNLAFGVVKNERNEQEWRTTNTTIVNDTNHTEIKVFALEK